MDINDVILTKKGILDKISQEEIFERYMGVEVALHRKYTNPFRDDNKAGCFFSYGKNGTLYFIDYAAKSHSEKSYSCFDVAMERLNCSFFKALHHIYNDISDMPAIRKSEVLEPPVRRDYILQINRRDYTPEELAFWNPADIVVTQAQLEGWGIYSVATLWENDKIKYNRKFNFAYVEEGVVRQVYMPNNKVRRFTNATGYKIGNLSKVKPNDILIITKSGKDSFFINLFGMPSIYVTSEAVLIEEELMNQLKKDYRTILTLFDNDDTGRSLSQQYEKTYNTISIFTPIKKDFYEWISVEGLKVRTFINQLKYDYQSKS